VQEVDASKINWSRISEGERIMDKRTITIVEALKMKKRLHKRLEDYRSKIKYHCAHMDNEKPVYGSQEDQRKRVQGWVQSHHDTVKNIEDLSIAIQKTNLSTEVEILLGGKPVKKTIAQWILRRQTLASEEETCYKSLTDRGLRDTIQTGPDGKTKIDYKVVRYYDAVDRDEKRDTFRHEPSMIDAKLEVVNATTNLVDEINVPEGE